MKRVYITPGDKMGWAVDDDRRQLLAVLEGVAEPSSLEDAEIIHSVWWERLGAVLSRRQGRRLLCNLTGEPRRCLYRSAFRRMLRYVDLWLAPSWQAYDQMRAAGLPVAHVPYTVDTTVFRRLPAAEIEEVRRQWELPADRYLIGSFQRDTEGSNLTSPKIVKGPDLFADLVVRLHRAGLPIHVVLAGPRRFWLRRQLESQGVPFTYTCKSLRPGDDVHRNVLDRATMNGLYNIIDLYAVTSRSEGGPKAILEAAAVGAPIVSSWVGQAPDVLAGACLYRTNTEAAAIIRRDIEQRWLRRFCEFHLAAVYARHTPERARDKLRETYEDGNRPVE